MSASRCCPWLALCAGVVAAIWPCAAYADDPDSLPTLDESAPLAAPEAPPAPVAAPVVLRRPQGRSEQLPIRAQRRLAVLGEVGWNGLAGFGPNLVYNVDPHLSFDLGSGLSLLGWKVGLRVRYNLLKGPVTPFLGVGVIGTGGLGDSPIPINDDKAMNKINIKVLPAAFLQTVGGIDWTTKSGFVLLGTVGYASLLSSDPVQVTSGTPTPDEERAFDIAFRSSLVLTVALGYAFR